MIVCTLSWQQFKSEKERLSLSLEWVDTGEAYMIVMSTAHILIQCVLMKDESDDTMDFEETYVNV